MNRLAMPTPTNGTVPRVERAYGDADLHNWHPTVVCLELRGEKEGIAGKAVGADRNEKYAYRRAHDQECHRLANGEASQHVFKYAPTVDVAIEHENRVDHEHRGQEGAHGRTLVSSPDSTNG